MHYNDYNTYLRKRYGCKVVRIGLDAGFTCPTRDGTKGSGGCRYCNGRGSRAAYADPARTVGEQLAARIAYRAATKAATKFIAYFQAFSNTYAPPARLKAAYDQVLPFNEVVGIAIGTRPDTVDAEKLSLIASYKSRYEVWMEYGLQSVHDRSLEAMGRGHTYRDFLDALDLTRRFSIPVCAHVIIGLPGEGRDEIMKTSDELRRLDIDGVKIHLFHVLKGSALEEEYRKGGIGLLTQDEYVSLAADFLERLSPRTVVQRLTGEGLKDEHVAPEWARDKLGTRARILERLKGRGVRSWCGRG